MTQTTSYQVTSPKSQEYNCFAWAAEDIERWWQPIPGEEFYWPDGVPNEEILDAYIQAYQTLGYQPCNNEQLEIGYLISCTFSTRARWALPTLRQNKLLRL